MPVTYRRLRGDVPCPLLAQLELSRYRLPWKLWFYREPNSMFRTVIHTISLTLITASREGTIASAERRFR